MGEFALVFLVSLAALAGADGDEASRTATMAFDDLVIEAGAVEFGMVQDCGWCKTCMGGHDMNAEGDRAWHDCLNIPCLAHPECGVGEEDADNLQTQETMASLVEAAGLGDVGTLKGFLARNPTQVGLNLDRMAIQVTNCGILHTNLPVEPAAFTELVEGSE